jgi:hypothetical protein
MARRFELDELVEHFTLLPDQVALFRNKSGPPGWGSRCSWGSFTQRGGSRPAEGDLPEDLPAPLGPRKPNTSPACTVRFNPSSARTLP